MVTEVGPVLLNVAVLSGTVLGVRVEIQLVPMVHSAPGPCQVPSTACAAPGPARRARRCRHLRAAPRASMRRVRPAP